MCEVMQKYEQIAAKKERIKAIQNMIDLGNTQTHWEKIKLCGDRGMNHICKNKEKENSNIFMRLSDTTSVTSINVIDLMAIGGNNYGKLKRL